MEWHEIDIGLCQLKIYILYLIDNNNDKKEEEEE